jgi:hypothetical protein
MSAESFMTAAGWRQTLREDGTSGLYDLTLLDPRGEPLGRVYRIDEGPHAGKWLWVVRNDLVFRGARTGHAASQQQARETVESIVGPQ